jgi:hypothetical protein
MPTFHQLAKAITSFDPADGAPLEDRERHYQTVHVPLVRALYRADRTRIAYATARVVGPEFEDVPISGWRYTFTWRMNSTRRLPENVRKLEEAMRADIPNVLQGMRRFQVTEQPLMVRCSHSPMRGPTYLFEFLPATLKSDDIAALKHWAQADTRLDSLAIDWVQGEYQIEKGAAAGQRDTGRLLPQFSVGAFVSATFVSMDAAAQVFSDAGPTSLLGRAVMGNRLEVVVEYDERTSPKTMGQALM